MTVANPARPLVAAGRSGKATLRVSGGERYRIIRIVITSRAAGGRLGSGTPRPWRVWGGCGLSTHQATPG
jgi:hypothetical protein